MNKYALIVAGGSGVRMGTATPKQFLLLRNQPVLWYTLTVFQQSFSGIQIIMVLPEPHLSIGRSIIASLHEPGNVQLAIGGPTRFHSVQNGLELVPAEAIVFVHDGVRCLLTPDLIQRCYASALIHGNAIPAVAATDSIRLVTDTGNEPVDRNKVRYIQTPQTFYSTVLKEAFRQPYDPAFTDEASVVERWGEKINLVEGEPANIKITQPIDLVLAAKILEERAITG